MKAALAAEEDGMKTDPVAEAHVEHYALKLFAHADSEDRAARHNKYEETNPNYPYTSLGLDHA